MNDLWGQLRTIATEYFEPKGVELIMSLARPAVRLCRSDEATRSRFGGLPLLVPGDSWPSRDGVALALVAVLDLADFSGFETDLPLPDDGIVNVFYDGEGQPWGFDPAHRQGWRVMFAEGESAVSIDAPPGTPTFAPVGLELTQTLTVPGWEEDAVASLFPAHEDQRPASEEAREQFVAFLYAWDAVVRDWTDSEDEVGNQVGGWPRLWQGPIWQECDQVSQGVLLGSRAAGDAAPPRSLDSEARWGLLLQLDSDDDADWMWGSPGGALYFAVPRPFDAAALPASAWMSLQCT